MGSKVWQDLSTVIHEDITNTSSARYGDDILGSTIARDTISIFTTESKELVSALSQANNSLAAVASETLSLASKANDVKIAETQAFMQKAVSGISEKIEGVTAKTGNSFISDNLPLIGLFILTVFMFKKGA